MSAIMQQGDHLVRPDSVNSTKTAVEHAVIISGLELALSLTNALDNATLRPYSTTSFVFFTSAVMELAGFLFAMWSAYRDRGAGSPILIVREALASGSRDLMAHAVMGGFVLQTFSVLCSAVVFVHASGIRAEGVGLGFTLMILCFSGFFVSGVFLGFLDMYGEYFNASQAPNNSPEERCACRGITANIFTALFKTISLPLFIAVVFAPLVIEVLESVLIFSSRPTSFAPYVLATLDLVLLVPVMYSVTIFVPCLLSLFREVWARDRANNR